MSILASAAMGLAIGHHASPLFGLGSMSTFGNDNPGAKSQGMKQLMAGGGVALIGITLVPLLTGLFG